MSDKGYYISCIEIPELFGNRHFCWSLNDKVNILGGINGSGKSTILKLCYQVLSTGVVDKSIAALAPRLIVHFTDGKKLEWHQSIIRPDVSPKEVSTWSFVVDARPDGTEVIQFISLYDADGNQCSMSEYRPYDFPVLIVNSFEQLIGAFEKDGSMSVGYTYLDALIQQQIIRRTSVFAGVLEKLFEQLNQHLTFEKAAERHPEIANFIEFYHELSVFMKNYSVLIDNRIRFRNSAGEEFDYTSLSMGEKQLLLLILMTTNTHSSPCVFFMDEPDLALHITWKKMLIRELRNLNPQMQIILATHAPSMIEGWYDQVKEVSQLIVP